MAPTAASNLPLTYTPEPVSSAKRKFDQLNEELQIYSHSRKRRRYSREQSGVLDALYKTAKWIPRGISPFVNILTAFQIGLHAEGQSDADTSEVGAGNGPESMTEQEENMQLSPAERSEFIRVYNGILDYTPSLRGLISEFQSEPASLGDLCALLDEHSRKARTQDCGDLRYSGVRYITPDPARQPIFPVIDGRQQSKSERGFQHQQCSRLLVPQRHLADFDADPEGYLRKIIEGRVKIRASMLPSFVYDEKSYDPHNILKGLFRGFFLVRVFRHIFTGPRTALKVTDGPIAGKPWNAQILGMLSVTKYSIAYAAVQARQLLNSQEEWSVEDAHFNAEHFFYTILAIFDDAAHSTWYEETIDWWNRRVFGNSYTGSDRLTHDDDSDDEESDLSLLKAQHAARQAVQ